VNNEQIQVVDDPAELRYELRLDGVRAGFIAYRREPGIVVLVHTDIDPAHEGKGLGSRLVAGALDDVRSRGLRVVPLCPFVAAYLRRHPEQTHLVVHDPQPRGNHLACLSWCGFIEARREHRSVFNKISDRRVLRMLDLGHALLADNAEHVATCCRIEEQA
jgi:predicted GNAT family acetyltransferase